MKILNLIRLTWKNYRLQPAPAGGLLLKTKQFAAVVPSPSLHYSALCWLSWFTWVFTRSTTLIRMSGSVTCNKTATNQWKCSCSPHTKNLRVLVETTIFTCTLASSHGLLGASTTLCCPSQFFHSSLAASARVLPQDWSVTDAQRCHVLALCLLGSSLASSGDSALMDSLPLELLCPVERRPKSGPISLRRRALCSRSSQVTSCTTTTWLCSFFKSPRARACAASACASVRL